MLICYSKIIFKYAYTYSILNKILFTLKLGQGAQLFLYEIRCLSLIYISIKFHHDTKPYIVAECNRNALQTVKVYFLQRAVTPLKSPECNLQIICATLSASKIVGGVIRK